jgi:lactoylglutathione lyase
MTTTAADTADTATPVRNPGSIASGPPKLGKFSLCLNVKDLPASKAFYEKLGFNLVGGDLSGGWAIMQSGSVEIGLFHKHIDNNLLNFRGADIFPLQQALKNRDVPIKTVAKHDDASGCETFYLEDPDGNLLMFDTCPGETA